MRNFAKISKDAAKGLSRGKDAYLIVRLARKVGDEYANILAGDKLEVSESDFGPEGFCFVMTSGGAPLVIRSLTEAVNYAKNVGKEPQFTRGVNVNGRKVHPFAIAAVNANNIRIEGQ